MKRVIFITTLYSILAFFCATPSVIIDYNFEYSKYTQQYEWITFSRYTLIIQETNKYPNVTVDQICALIHHESNGYKYAVSCARARGLMQIMPVHARINKVSIEDLFNEAINIRIGTQYFAWCMRRFGNNFKYAIMAYNAGPHSNFAKYDNDWYLYGIMKYAKVTQSTDMKQSLPYNYYY